MSYNVDNFFYFDCYLLSLYISLQFSSKYNQLTVLRSFAQTFCWTFNKRKYKYHFKSLWYDPTKNCEIGFAKAKNTKRAFCK